MPRRFQFSLRTMLMALTVFASAAALVSIRFEAKHREQAAIAKLAEKGAHVVYDWQLANPTAKAPPGARFIGENMSDLLFANVAAIDGNKSDIGDGDLALLREFPRLEILYLYRTKVTDAGIGHLCSLTALKELSLHNTRVSRSGVEELESALRSCRIVWPNPEETASSRGVPRNR